MHGVPPDPALSAAVSTAPPATRTEVGDDRWQSLTAFLDDLQADSIVLSFDTIGKIIGSELPETASSLGYWSNSVYNTMARRWWDAGFRTSTRDLPEEHIRFDRVTFPGLTN